MGLRLILVAAVLTALAACSRGGGGGENLGVASGNSLTPAEIDAALGPAKQAQPLPNSVAMPTNATVAARRRSSRSPTKTG